MRPDKVSLQSPISLRGKPVKMLPQIAIGLELPKTDALRKHLKNVERTDK